MSHPTSRPTSMAHPRYWPSWLLVGLMWLAARLPFRWLAAMTMSLGRPLQALMGRRRKVAERNIQACFPELDEAKRQALVDESFRSLGRSLAEFLYCWGAPVKRVRALCTVVGQEHLEQALAGGEGVILLTAHMSCMEIGGCVTCNVLPGAHIAPVYRPLKNPVMEWYQNRGRLRFASALIQKRDTRGAIKHLRQGHTLWYAPDQDFGPEQSLFVPLFGIATASLLATHRLAKLGRAKVVPMVPRVQDDGHYRIELLPALEEFPSDDAEADLTRVNQLLEDWIRAAPGQYWWIHRRFKTRPEGEAPFYD